LLRENLRRIRKRLLRPLPEFSRWQALPLLTWIAPGTHYRL
jgi:hypothetical protein